MPPTPSAFPQSEYDVEGYPMHLGTIPHHSHSADALDAPIIGRHFSENEGRKRGTTLGRRIKPTALGGPSRP
jgi:hypothetical protein